MLPRKCTDHRTPLRSVPSPTTGRKMPSRRLLHVSEAARVVSRRWPIGRAGIRRSRRSDRSTDDVARGLPVGSIPAHGDHIAGLDGGTGWQRRERGPLHDRAAARLAARARSRSSWRACLAPAAFAVGLPRPDDHEDLGCRRHPRGRRSIHLHADRVQRRHRDRPQRHRLRRFPDRGSDPSRSCRPAARRDLHRDEFATPGSPPANSLYCAARPDGCRRRSSTISVRGEGRPLRAVRRAQEHGQGAGERRAGRQP